MTDLKFNVRRISGVAAIWLSVVSIAAIFGIGDRACAENLDLPKEVRFNEHIRPIFMAHCTACHGGVKQAGEVSFAYRDQVLPPDGWIVEPGHPEDSVLIERINSDDSDTLMPPPEHGSPLSKNEIALLTEWIRQGAKWEDHWAFATPKPQPIPSVRHADWCRQPIDNFIVETLEQAGIEPAPEASPERWLRRVTLDLIGLPPTLQERSQFLQDLEKNGETAYANVVDRLLDSTRYGEHWASVWLDQVRYADSKGLGADGKRNIWKYRDWVIDAFNRDMPYDEFTIKQIAGDLLPDRTIEDQIATAAHRLTQTNEEGGTDDEEFRVAAVLDRVSTVWQTWQGVTFGCIQCHSHPYDPFSHEEFYKFAAFFNNTSDCDLGEEWPILQAPVDPADYDKAGRIDGKIERLRDNIWKQEYALLKARSVWQPLVGLTASSSNATRLKVERKGDHDEFFTSGTITQNADFTLDAPLPDSMRQLTAIRLTVVPHNPEQAVADSEWGFVLSNVEASILVPGEKDARPLKVSRLLIDEPNPYLNPQDSLNPKSKDGFAAYTRIHYPRQAALVLDSPVEFTAGSNLRVTLKHRYYILASFALITRRGHLAVSDDEAFMELMNDRNLAAQRFQLAALRQERAKIRSTPTPVLEDRIEHLARPTHVFIRGLFLTKDKEVTAGTPASLPPLPADLPRNRLALAKWLVSDQNPLTARVAVNRVWANVFGIGLVATEEDFGSSGDAPSHPELLDFLAIRFQHDYHWSFKHLLRDIVLSSTYRQSSTIRPELRERDPQNRLLASGPRFRLSAEAVRDQALVLAGLLNDKMFGPPVYPPLPDGTWTPFKSNEKWETDPESQGDRHRRSIYTYLKRSIPYPMFAAFDAPSREFCTPRRLRSNTPLQSLMMLNDTTFDECAEALGKRMLDAAEAPREQIRFGFLVTTCREPQEDELEDLLELHHRCGDATAASGLTTVAAVLLNLDEVITK